MKLADVLHLQPDGPDRFVGSGPRYPWGGLYGGQIVAQALRAAGHTVPPRHQVHSLHAYFILRGDPDAPVKLEVDRIRDGRSFSTRRVVARQAAGAILNLSASFCAPEGEEDLQTAPMPEDVPMPEDAEADDSSIKQLKRRYVARGPGGRLAAWFKPSAPMDDSPITHACALAFCSDDFPCGAVMRGHPDWSPGGGKLWMTSLDHAMWFHRPVRADDWLLVDVRCKSLVGAHGVAVGEVHDQQGRHVASITQEVLLRRKR